MNLETLQTALIEQVITDNNKPPELLEQLQYCRKLSPVRQIEIYRSNVLGALQSTLKQIYPVCLRIVGENYFLQIANEYIRNHPSNCSDLNQYGSTFSDFLQTLLTQRSELMDYAYLPDLAKFEKFHHDVYFVNDDKPFNFEYFSALSENDYQTLYFKISNALKIMKTPFPVLAIWNTNKEQENTEEAIQIPEREQTLVIFRQQFQVKADHLDPTLYQFLQMIIKGSTFSELIGQFESITDFDVNIQLTKLIAKGWIIGFEIANV